MKRVWEQAAEWIVRLNDATATESDFTQWQAWLGKDPKHAQAFQELQDTWRRSASVAQLCAADSARDDDVDMRRGGARKQRTGFFFRHGRGRGMPPYAMAAGAAAAAVAVAILLGSAVESPVQEIETTVTELRFLTLPDGTHVSLGPQTALEVKFSDRRRVVEMRSGEAYFQIARAPERPFSIQTAAGRITALGTAFSVNTGENRLAVAVTEGVVRVESSAGILSRLQSNGQSSPFVLSVGQKYTQDGPQRKTSKLASLEAATAWREGRLEYQGEPLRVVVADLNRYSRVKVRLDDRGLRELRYTGTVFPDTLDAWLDSIEGVFPLRVEKRAGERRIVAAK